MDPAIRPKVTKKNLVQAATREIARLDKFLLGCLGCLFLIIIFECLFHKLGWYAFLISSVPIVMFTYINNKVEAIRARINRYKNLKPQRRKRY